MARAQETFGKKEREKKRLKKREEKKKRKEARKSEEKNDEFIYVDEFGQLTSTPPDPTKKIKKVDAESIVLGIPKKEDQEPEDPIRNGKVSFYDDKKGFGFILDLENQEKYFVHVSGLLDDIMENDKVTFELERGQKGMNAVRVKKQ